MSVPDSGRLAGIDYGHVRIGIAVCDPGQSLASPLENYTRNGDQADGRRFQKLAADEELVGFVIGLPVHTNGMESAKSLEAREFGKWLTKTTGLPVAYHDERFTSQEAERHLDAAGLTKKRRKQRLDMLAAQIILASFLESAAKDAPPQALDD
jgi:putative Holliday junction resolvase